MHLCSPRVVFFCGHPTNVVRAMVWHVPERSQIHCAEPQSVCDAARRPTTRVQRPGMMRASKLQLPFYSAWGLIHWKSHNFCTFVMYSQQCVVTFCKSRNLELLKSLSYNFCKLIQHHWPTSFRKLWKFRTFWHTLCNFNLRSLVPRLHKFDVRSTCRNSELFI